MIAGKDPAPPGLLRARCAQAAFSGLQPVRYATALRRRRAGVSCDSAVQWHEGSPSGDGPQGRLFVNANVTTHILGIPPTRGGEGLAAVTNELSSVALSQLRVVRIVEVF